MTDEPKTIDLTPSWRGVLPILLHVYHHASTGEARATAFAELAKMAELADAYVAENAAADRKGMEI